MSDTELRRFGKAAAAMCPLEANLGRSSRKAFVIQLKETRAEWQRRKNGGHPVQIRYLTPNLLTKRQLAGARGFLAIPWLRPAFPFWVRLAWRLDSLAF